MATTRALILVIDDDPSIRNYLRATLLSFAFRVKEAPTGSQGLWLARTLKPDLILLDLGLPDMDGLELAREVRGWTHVPIIVISARRKEEDMVRALDAGADDYLTKPFGSGELLARIRVALRRTEQAAEASPRASMTKGPLKVDFASRKVTVDGQEVHLTPNEYTLLAALLKQCGKVLSHHELLHEVQLGSTSPPSTSLLRVYMANLRRKLEAEPGRPRLIVTEPGVGYRLHDHPSITTKL